MTIRKYKSVDPGEEVVVVDDWHKEEYFMACCDCHLVHKLRFKVSGKKVIMIGWRDERRTSALRRYRGVPINEK